MKFDLTITMGATQMFNGGADLKDEIFYALDSGFADGAWEFDELTPEENIRLFDVETSLIMKFVTYNKEDLYVDYTDYDMGELYIYYIIPIDIDVKGIFRATGDIY